MPPSTAFPRSSHHIRVDVNNAQTYTEYLIHAPSRLDMLDDPSIDAIYNPLPNGLHYEWTMKALKAGKHVLVEVPSTNRSSEAKEMFALAKEKNLVLLEAFHYRYDP
jgi:predicted dehydrogenase